ncbi:dipeptidase [Rathayibacter sp. VKM Ac-2760]|uniref:dipeptidase n=1 Tax=Rathayibacter sp. VKM Ac-2760 TaxID=2609253 RepID=UPI001317DF72|nr:dipeptidase [Rathayibacter sp. VKM Ac-2760]QHC58425.1 M20/M25/M40 family metallo-hydrolase [Rathayibacter sp. VKM Ac-2760]
MASDAPTPASALPAAEEAVLAAVLDDLPRSLAELGRLVRIPSVSWDGFDATRVAASAEATAELARETGAFDEVSIRRSTIGDTDRLGHPAVLATRAARNGAPTVLLYAHHDVQPQGAEESWETPPFEPTVRGDRLYGRGAADDKAGVVSHLAAVRALREVAGDDHDLGLVLFIEGEEEFGSRSFPTFLREHHDALRADVIVVADSDNWDVDTPSLTVGLRGNVTLTLTVRTLDHASHSGMLGGAVPDAMLATIRLLDTLWNEDGSVAVAGLTEHDGVVPETTEEDLRRDAGLLDGVSPIGSGPFLSRIWSKPSITVTGIDAPSVVDASNTLSPSVRVKISARIAPGQEAPEGFAALERHLRANAPFGAHLEIADVDTGEPFLVDTSGWAVSLVKQAMADAWGRAALETSAGGSIPFIADLVREFPAAQILVTGVEDPDSRAHSPNESLHLGVFKRAAQTEALFLLRAAGHRA